MYCYTMVGPSSQISKLLLILLLLFVLFFLYMDYNLYYRIHNYPIDRGVHEDNSSSKYQDVTWIDCKINPLCDVTVKAVLLDHINLYLFSPLATMFEQATQLGKIEYITPNSISFFHVFVAILSAKCVSSDNLAHRRVGVILFEIRTWLDDLDGHLARVRKHVKGERSEIGTSGYYIDGLCDAIGCVALMIGIFIFLKNNPPRRGYMQLPINENKEASLIFKTKVTTTRKVIEKICCFSSQLIISSTAWNRYIALYQDLLERNSVPYSEFENQNIVFKSTFFFVVGWLWRVVNVHSLIHCLLLVIFCDKLWEFLRNIQYIGYGILIAVICITEVHVLDVKNFIFHKLTGSGTNF